MSEEQLPVLLAEVETRLQQSLECEIPIVRELGLHVLEAGGKRIRPRMTLLACAAVGYQQEARFNLAAAFELIHTATLIHDDIVDNSTQRRRRLSANARWNNATAVLSGDYLYSRAFELLTSAREIDLLRYISSITNLLAQGELMQLGHVHAAMLTEQQYFSVIHYKTACLFEACAKSVNYLTELTPELSNVLEKFGLTFGEAFQLRDDYLDYLGDLEAIGKPRGGDLMGGKPTLPYIYARQNVTCPEQQRVLRAAIETPDASGGNFSEVAQVIESHGGFSLTLAALDERLLRLEWCMEQMKTLCRCPEYVEQLGQLVDLLRLPALPTEGRLKKST